MTLKTVFGISSCISALCPQVASAHPGNPARVRRVWLSPRTHPPYRGCSWELSHWLWYCRRVADLGYKRPSNVQKSGMKHWPAGHVQWDWQKPCIWQAVVPAKLWRGWTIFWHLKAYHRGEIMSCSPCLWYTGWKGMALNGSRRFPVRHWICFLICKNCKALKWVA